LKNFLYFYNQLIKKIIQMNSFERKIQEHNNLQKAVVESLTGQNEVQAIVETLLKAGVKEEDLIEKAKYIRREGTKGNYKYIYEEPKGKDLKEVTTEDIKNMSSKEKINLALEGNAAAQRALDYGEYQHFLSLSRKQQPEKKEDDLNFENTPRGVVVSREKDGKREIYVAKEKTWYPKSAFVHSQDWQGVHFKNLEEAKSNFKKSLEPDIEKAETGEKKVAKVMKEFKEGKLKDSHGNTVTDRDQAIAIAMSEAGMNNK